MIDLLRESFPEAEVMWEPTPIPSNFYRIKSPPYGIYMEQFETGAILMTIFKKNESGEYDNVGGASGTEPQEMIDYIKEKINPKIV